MFSACQLRKRCVRVRKVCVVCPQGMRAMLGKRRAGCPRDMRGKATPRGASRDNLWRSSAGYAWITPSVHGPQDMRGLLGLSSRRRPREMPFGTAVSWANVAQPRCCPPDAYAYLADGTYPLSARYAWIAGACPQDMRADDARQSRSPQDMQRARPARSAGRPRGMRSEAAAGCCVARAPSRRLCEVDCSTRRRRCSAGPQDMRAAAWIRSLPGRSVTSRDGPSCPQDMRGLADVEGSESTAAG